MKRVLIITGPPRSGTSLLANIIHKLGVDFSNVENFISTKKNKHNPIFFELKRVNEINDRIFSIFGKRWDQFDWLPSLDDFNDELTDLFRKDIIELIESSFENKNLIGIKDPRFCFTLPLWKKILNDEGYNIDYIISTRNYSDVINSNNHIKVSNNKTINHEDNVNTVLLSLMVVNHFLKNEKKLYVNYDDVLNDSENTIDRITNFLMISSNLKNKSSAIKSINRDLNHNKNKGELYSNLLLDNLLDNGIIKDFDYLKYLELINIYKSTISNRNDRQKENFSNDIKALKSFNDELKNFNDRQKENFSNDIKVLKSLNDELKLELNKANSNLNRVESQLENIKNSFSWRITRILRIIRTFFN